MAIAFSTGASLQNATGNALPATGQTFGVGQLLIGLVQAYYGGTGSSTIAMSDNVNTGAWTNARQLLDATGSGQIAILYKVTNAALSAGAITYTATGLNSGVTNANMIVAAFTGFVGTPTVISADGATASGATASISIGPVAASQSNELFVTANQYANGITSGFPPAGWSQTSGLSSQALLYRANVASGTNVSLTATMSAAGSWESLMQGFYDAVAATTHPNLMMLGVGS
ncbi:MAG: hypothetical protein KGL39_60440 [Patescibacteria group bacterium]|nr:hypothetical protein [Patescibacteria group bacterium]